MRYRSSAASGHWSISGRCGARQRCCSRRSCPSRGAWPPRHSSSAPCSARATSHEAAGGSGTCCHRWVAIQTGISAGVDASGCCGASSSAGCRAAGGSSGSKSTLARAGSGFRPGRSTVGRGAGCGPRSPQGGHELLASPAVATRITQKSTFPPVRGELRFGFRVYSAGDRGRVPAGVPSRMPDR